MAQILLPRAQPVEQKERKEDPIDKLLRGLSVANQVLGVAANVSSLKSSAERRDLAAAEELRAQDRHRAMIAENFEPAEGADRDAVMLSDGKWYVPAGGSSDTAYSPNIYADAEGKSRIGKWSRRTGLLTSDKDPYAPMSTAGDRQTERSDRSEFYDSVNLVRGIGRGTAQTVGKYNMRVKLSQDGLRLIDQVKADPDMKFNRQMAQELATVVATTLAGGNQAAITAIEHMVPQTAMGSAESIVQWVAGHPREFLTSPMVTHFEHQLEGQHDFWKEQIENVIETEEIKLSGVLQRNPELQQQWHDIKKKLQENMTLKRAEPKPRKVGGDGTAFAAGGGTATERQIRAGMVIRNKKDGKLYRVQQNGDLIPMR